MKKVPGQRVTAAGVLLVTHRNASPEFLLMRHSDRWDLPKGHCDKGESFRQTALRETEEETGIDPDTIQLDPIFSFELIYPVRYQKSGEQTFEKQVRYFLGLVTSKPNLTLTEHESAHWHQWAPPHSIQSETIDPLLDAVAKHIEIHGWNRRVS
ncbi:MAG: bis(5'-nucleosyl)-tetraphosphatase [Rubripirellula sp.]